MRVLALVCLVGLVAISGAVPVGAQPPTQVAQTLLYRDITAPSDEQIDDRPRTSPRLSEDGTTAVYAITREDGPEGRDQSHVFVVDVDAGTPREVDVVPHATGLDLSADGRRVLIATLIRAGGPSELHIADAGGMRTLLVETGTWLDDSVLTSDGHTVFFRLGGTTRLEGVGRAEPGVWAVAADGGTPRQVVDTEAVAAATGAAPDDELSFSVGARTLDASADGTQIIFGVVNWTTGTRYVLGASGDGGGVHPIVGPVDAVRRAVLSSDGSTVLTITSAEEGYEIAATGFAGTDRRVVRTTEAPPDGGVSISGDGSLALLGSKGELVGTDGTGPVTKLGVSCAGSDLIVDTLARIAMDASAQRFVYLSTDYYPVPLSLLEVDPASLPAAAPVLTAPTVEPSAVGIGDGSTATVSVQLDVPSPGTCVTVLNGTIDETSIGVGVAYRTLFDDGWNGDAVAGDGVWTNATLAVGAEAEPGPRTVRVGVSIEGDDGRRIAVAVDLQPFAVGTGPEATPGLARALPW